MTTTILLWIAAGLSAGVGHAWLLWKASQPPFRWAAAGLLRLLPVAALFVVASIWGGLLPVALGWVTAFAATVVALARRTAT